MVREGLLLRPGGSGHFCFETKKDCTHEQKQDNIAETPCYDKDRTA